MESRAGLEEDFKPVEGEVRWRWTGFVTLNVNAVAEVLRRIRKVDSNRFIIEGGEKV